MQRGEKSISLPIRLKLGDKVLCFGRADIKFAGIDQAGKSFEGRVFLNNPAADENTPTTKEQGYSGSFHVYGFGLRPGDFGKAPSDSQARDAVLALRELTEMDFDLTTA
jgi:hypothetical protein